MTKRHLLFRNLAYYWRTNLAVIVGVATAVAVLSGALLVGGSVQDSLRSLLYQRLGATEYVVAADRFFHENLFEAFGSSDQSKGAAASCPIIFLQGILINPDTDTRVHNVNVYGVDSRFWSFHAAAVPRDSDDRMALVGQPLAEKLGLKKGDPLLLRIETQQGIPRESLYGRKDNLGRTIRLRCGDLLPSEEMGEFALRPNQGNIYSIFVPLERLQKDLQQPSRTNVVLFASRSRRIDLQDIRDWLKDRFTLEDVGLRLRQLPSRSVISIESTHIILDESIARAVTKAASEEGLPISGLYTYLANSMRVADREIPYSAISAADLGLGALTSIRPTRRYATHPEHANADAEIWLTDWAWNDLRPNPGDPVEIEYYLWQEDGRLATRTARFRLAGVIPIGGDVNASLTPDFPGISEARSISAWDPPFPVDLNRIRPADEEYWDRYKATPKAFISLAEGQHLWQSRFGNLTSLRIALPETQDPKSMLESLAGKVRSAIVPESAGFSVNAVRESGLEASRGSTDFG